MARRTLLGCLPLAALSMLTWTACSKGDGAKPKGGTDLEARCEQLGKFCGDKDKHIGKIADECKAAAKVQIEKGCADKVITLFDCYEKDVCGINDKVWALGDIRVLAARKTKCVAEQAAVTACEDKK